MFTQRTVQEGEDKVGENGRRGTIRRSTPSVRTSSEGTYSITGERTTGVPTWEFHGRNIGDLRSSASTIPTVLCGECRDIDSRKDFR